jgi:type III pantothenate kinase
MKLLLDAGNSRLKWAMVERGAEPVTGAVSPDADGLSELAGRIAAEGAPERVALVSVRDAAFSDQVSGWCVQQGLPSPFVVCAGPGLHGIRPAYARVEALGTDRYAAMVAARRLFEGPLVVVDCGTAVTVDALDEHGRHLGGLILPGLSLMRRSLCAGTAALPDVDERRVSCLAGNTVDQIASGTALGLASAVDGLCERVTEVTGPDPVRVLTGGDAALIDTHGRLSYAWRPWLVFQGAYFIMEGDACDPWRSS